jgi:hypothetical protein
MLQQLDFGNDSKSETKRSFFAMHGLTKGLQNPYQDSGKILAPQSTIANSSFCA